MTQSDLLSDVLARYRHALEISETERRSLDLCSQLLPTPVVDCHTHTNLPEHIADPVGPTTQSHMMSTFPFCSLEQSRDVAAHLFPGATWHAIRFPHVLREIDRKSANSYLLNGSSRFDHIAICGLVEDPDYTIDLLHSPSVVALKMYPHDSERIRPLITDYFLPEFLEACQTLGKPIILHLPRPLPECFNELAALTKQFPDLPVVLAHCGLIHVATPELATVFRRCSGIPSLFVDTARVEDPHVLAEALRAFGSDRVLFGSDEPLDLLRSRAFIHPVLGERIVPDIAYPWTDPIEFAEYGHLAVNHRTTLGAVRCHLPDAA